MSVVKIHLSSKPNENKIDNLLKAREVLKTRMNCLQQWQYSGAAQQYVNQHFQL